MTNLATYINEVRKEAEALGYPHHLVGWIEPCGFIFDCLDFGKTAKYCAQRYVDNHNRVVNGK